MPPLVDVLQFHFHVKIPSILLLQKRTDVSDIYDRHHILKEYDRYAAILITIIGGLDAPHAGSPGEVPPLSKEKRTIISHLFHHVNTYRNAKPRNR